MMQVLRGFGLTDAGNGKQAPAAVALRNVRFLRSAASQPFAHPQQERWDVYKHGWTAVRAGATIIFEVGAFLACTIK